MNDKDILEYISSGYESVRTLGNLSYRVNTAVHIKYEGTRSVPSLMVSFVPEIGEWVVFIEDWIDDDMTIKTWKRASLEYSLSHGC